MEIQKQVISSPLLSQILISPKFLFRTKISDVEFEFVGENKNGELSGKGKGGFRFSWWGSSLYGTSCSSWLDQEGLILLFPSLQFYLGFFHFTIFCLIFLLPLIHSSWFCSCFCFEVKLNCGVLLFVYVNFGLKLCLEVHIEVLGFFELLCNCN